MFFSAFGAKGGPPPSTRCWYGLECASCPAALGSHIAARRDLNSRTSMPRLPVTVITRTSHHSRFASQARLRWPRGHTTRPRVGTPDHQMHHHEVTRRRSVFSSAFDRIFKKVTTDRILRILGFSGVFYVVFSSRAEISRFAHGPAEKKRLTDPLTPSDPNPLFRPLGGVRGREGHHMGEGGLS